MNVKNLLKYLGIKSENEKEINNVVMSTKDVMQDDLLICIKGNNVNPSLLISKNIIDKAALILSDDESSPYYIENLKQKVGDLLDYFYFNHKHNVKIIGVTGSEGKSSLCDIIYQSLSYLKRKTLLLTNENKKYSAFTTSLTTCDTLTFFHALKKAEEEHYQYLISEVSSISIDQDRIMSYIFDYIFLTNLNVDHLDYHKNIYQYHSCKISLLQRNKKGIKFIFKSTYDMYPNLFNTVSNLKIIDDNKITLKNNSLSHQIFIYNNINYYTNLVFKSNRNNLVMNIAFLESLNVKKIPLIIRRIRRVKGRSDLIHTRPYIMIDYAHSKQSMEMIMKEVSSFKQNRLIVVFGAGGNRDKTKRIEYGKSAEKYADKVILTNDNPRFEPPEDILKMIIPSNSRKFEIVLNRKKAIIKAYKELQNNDILLILGRGNEDYMEIQNRKIYINDYEIVNELIHSK